MIHQKKRGPKKREISIDNLVHFKLRSNLEYLLGFKIPKNFLIHHIDKNIHNNILDNLALVTTSNHRRIHPMWLNKKAKPKVKCLKMTAVKDSVDLYISYL